MPASFPFLVDNNLSPRLAAMPRNAGHDAVHIKDIAEPSSPDEVVLDIAVRSGRVILAQGTDFGTILAKRAASWPSFVLFRQTRKSTEAIFAVLTANFDSVRDLEAGAIVVFDDARIRVRRLPIG